MSDIKEEMLYELSSQSRRRFLTYSSAAALVAAAGLTFPRLAKANINNNILGYEWMKHLDDSMRLTDLSIPGTHNSAAGGYDSWEGGAGSDYAECHVKNCKHQLLSGFRFLDLRIDCDAGDSGKYKMKIFHGGYYCCTLQAVMSDVNEFLEKYPTECVLIRFKKEGDNSSDATWVRTFHEYMEEMRGGDKNLPHSDYMYTPNSDSLPSLGEVRGKWLIVSQVSGLSGFHWGAADVQDNYDPGSISNKKNSVHEQLRKSVLAPRNNTKLYINFISGTGIPGFWGIPTGPDTVADELLPYIRDKVKPANWDQFGSRPVEWFRTGVVMHDLPNNDWRDQYHEVAERIYLTNKDLYNL
ncbi:phosphatidylinositol-specific phospholipase C domain-containing protein [Vibrio aestuarianus]|uniref:phosphatidylinositol-specific phospholipase C domain-containing protein n=1 Tax=Vibrio aestuarianus TaxID=28171 RepID=UPI00237CF97B|nr:phosphatidylinositol-specific phospholipase C domain-containing protein [Vibrio aestuarianus]MDE1263877.1 phosphatidylinositol-specific phospholipase C domain-containing protein [Vibrio aestuarianus]MDE1295805.1 phosphatidylinositol-specific phospholipase C domain-containing protein [Vibrio aestuarianus]